MRVDMTRYTFFTLLVGTLLCSSPVAAAVIQVPAGGDFQAALNAAVPGDEIVLTAAARYVGEFKLPAKPFGPAITVRTSSLALPLRRISAADQPLLPTLASEVSAPALVGYNTGNWKFVGIHVESTPSGHAEIIDLENADAITFDRLLIIVGPNGQKRGIKGNGRNITVIRSFIDGVTSTTQDAQAFCAWNGAGPYSLIDSYFGASGENVMFGGADSMSPANVPSNILIENSTLAKNPTWKGKGFVVKNLLELKAAKNVTVRHTLFENNWGGEGQAGAAIVFTPRNQDGMAPWTAVQNVTFEYSVVRNTPSIFNMQGYDDIAPSLQTTEITIRHVLAIATGGYLLQTTNEVGTLTFDHVTFLSQRTTDVQLAELNVAGAIPVAGSSPRMPQFSVANFTVRNSMLQHNQYGVRSDKFGAGLPTLNGRTQTWTWQNNVLGGGVGFLYPPSTTFISESDYVAQFTGTEFLLVPTSAFKGKATDGMDLGWSGQGLVPVPPPPPPVSLASPTVTFTVVNCRLTVAAVPPDQTGGWRAQFKRGTTNVGTVDASAPFTRTTTVPAGNYSITAVWTKTGKPTQITPVTNVSCK